MPVDAAIPLGFQSPPPIDPMRSLAGFAEGQAQIESARALREQREAQANLRRRQATDQDAYDRSVSEGGDRDAIVARLPGHMQAGVRKSYAEADEAAAKWQKAVA